MVEKKLGTLIWKQDWALPPPPPILLMKSGIICILSFGIFCWPLKIIKDKNDLSNLLINIHVISFFDGLSPITCSNVFAFKLK